MLNVVARAGDAVRRWLLALCVLYAPWTAAAVLKPRPTFRQALARLTVAMARLQAPMAAFGAQLATTAEAMAKVAAAMNAAVPEPPRRHP